MKSASALTNYVLLHDSGAIHYPFSKFLTDEHTNPNTRDLVAQSLRVLYRFLTALQIELALRALEGRCLIHDELNKLAGLCYRPLEEIEAMSDKKVALIISAKAGVRPESLHRAMESNTAAKRLNHIASYLDHYHTVFIRPSIRTAATRESLKIEYQNAIDHLKNKVRGTKQNSHNDIQSLPSDKFKELIRAIYVRPHELFITDSGKPSRTWRRDRAMALLAAEGLRPGTIGNIGRRDFRPHSKHLVIEDHRDKRETVSSSTPLLKLGSSTKVNSASETMIELWPFTVDAVNEYIADERDRILAKHLRNRSRSFLFLNEKGEPLGHRSTITAMFNRLGKRLSTLGLLDVGNDPYFKDKKTYDFYAYVLRHSSANLYLVEKGTTDSAQDSMKPRFGWTIDSKQPARYAARAISDSASIKLNDFYQSMITEVQQLKAKNGRVQ